jgi:hypothetical protein
MARKTHPTNSPLRADMTESSVQESKLEGFAEDLGRLLGEAQNKAEGWLGQRKAIAEHLVGVRDTATRLLAQLGIDNPSAAQKRRGRPVGSGAAKRGPGRPAAAASETKTTPKRRTISAAGRARIAAAQRARWAKLKAAKK